MIKTNMCVCVVKYMLRTSITRHNEDIEREIDTYLYVKVNLFNPQLSFSVTIPHVLCMQEYPAIDVCIHAYDGN